MAGRWQVNPPVPALTHPAIPPVLVPVTPIGAPTSFPNNGLGD
ncbi:MAG: hypothetical protein ACYDBJ_16455 [Aggregatilineales bacterium]